MVHLELNDPEKLTQKPYQYCRELKFIIFKIVTEMRVVIETFSTKEFLELVSQDKEKNENLKNTGLEQMI